MRHNDKRHPGLRTLPIAWRLFASALIALPTPALADAGGVSFWLPGAFGSLAATPVVPGWAYSTIYLHLQANAGATQNFVTSNGARGSVVTGLSARADALAVGITYTSPTPVLRAVARTHVAKPAADGTPLLGRYVPRPDFERKSRPFSPLEILLAVRDPCTRGRAASTSVTTASASMPARRAPRGVRQAKRPECSRRSRRRAFRVLPGRNAC